MAMFQYSRYRYCDEVRDEQDRNYLLEREPFRYMDEPDNIYHTAQDGDTWWGLAHVYFQGIPRACGLWWVIADFQPTPVLDPTLCLKAGTTIIVPSMRTLRMQVFDNQRRRFH